MGKAAAALVTILAAAALPGCAVFADLNDVKLETGYEDMEPGDSVVLKNVRGNFGSFVSRGVYRLRGKYTLESRDEAILAVGVLDGDCSGDTSVRVIRGTGVFELSFLSARMGQPYLSFRPVGDEARPFGVIFFGTGDTVRREAPEEAR